MAKGKKSGGGGKLTLGRKASRGPAKEVHTGSGGVQNTVAGKGVKRQKGGGAKAAAKVPGAVKGA
jgi:hypothetical protein